MHFYNQRTFPNCEETDRFLAVRSDLRPAIRADRCESRPDLCRKYDSRVAAEKTQGREVNLGRRTNFRRVNTAKQ